MSTYILDTETTGGDEPRIIEAAWLELSDPETLLIKNQFCQRYNPGIKSTLGALATHHILDSELVDCPSHTEFKLPDGTKYIIGHNVDYDWKAIGQPDVKRICTLAISRNLFPQLDSHSQSAMLYYFIGANARPRLKEAHSALQDVQNCLVILSYLLIISFDHPPSWDEIYQFSEEARIPAVISFGKHKGTAIKDLPLDYKQWLLRQSDIDPYLMKALKGEVA